MLNWNRVFLLLFLILTPIQLSAENVLQFVNPPTQVTFASPNGYNPKGGSSPSETHSLFFSKVQSPPSATLEDAFVTINPNESSGWRQATNGSGDTIDYRIHSTSPHQSSSIIRAKTSLPNSSGANADLKAITFSVGDQTVEGTYDIKVRNNNNNKNADPGNYTDTITFQLWRGNASSTVAPSRHNEDRQIQIVIPVQQVQSLDLFLSEGSGWSRDATLSFGEMTASATAQVTMRLISNVSTRIQVSSLNGSLLKHENNANQTVSYTMRKSNGNAINLSTPGANATLINNQSAKTDGRSVTYSFELPGTIPFVSAGSYSDTLTFTITTR